MNLIKTFKTTVRDMGNIDDVINVWVEEENVKILNISVVHGENYTTFGNRIENKEILLIVLYTKNS